MPCAGATVGERRLAAAHIPEEELEKLPRAVKARIRNLAAMACRTGDDQPATPNPQPSSIKPKPEACEAGDRKELTKGTLTYSAMTGNPCTLISRRQAPGSRPWTQNCQGLWSRGRLTP
jgi:hypothetical protein